MSKSKRWQKPLVSLGVVAAALVGGWFALIPMREARALQLVEQANALHQTNPAKAIAILKEANFISRTQAGTIHLAQFQLEAGDASSALTTLTQAKHRDTAYWLYQGEAMLELNRVDEGKKALASSQDPQAAQILELLKSDQPVIAGQKLSNLKLLRTAARTLESASNLNSSGFILLSRLRLALPETTHSQITDLQKRLQTAITNDPASIELHDLLRQVDLKLGDQKDAAVEAAEIEALKSGKI